MTLIWKNLLHANFRCGRMYSARAEKETLSQSCTVPSMPRMRERMLRQDRQKVLSGERFLCPADER